MVSRKSQGKESGQEGGDGGVMVVRGEGVMSEPPVEKSMEGGGGGTRAEPVHDGRSSRLEAVDEGAEEEVEGQEGRVGESKDGREDLLAETDELGTHGVAAEEVKPAGREGVGRMGHGRGLGEHLGSQMAGLVFDGLGQHEPRAPQGIGEGGMPAE